MIWVVRGKEGARSQMSQQQCVPRFGAPDDPMILFARECGPLADGGAGVRSGRPLPCVPLLSYGVVMCIACARENVRVRSGLCLPNFVQEQPNPPIHYESLRHSDVCSRVWYRTICTALLVVAA